MSTERMLRRRWRHAGEAAALRLLLALLRPLRVDRASALGGALARAIGPLLPVHRRALRNLAACLPETSARERRAIARRMWDNLGRGVAEFAFLDVFHEADGRIAVIGRAHLAAVLGQGRGAILVSAHLANWELLPVAAARHGVPAAMVYRAANNPAVDALLRAWRARHGTPLQVPKGAAGARRLLGLLQERGHVAMLIDQKMNDGIAVPFFGRPAMTAPAAAQLARRFGCPILPIRIERLAGARFRITVLPPLTVARGADRAADIRAATAALNRLVEDWIRARPEQWLWLHRRWPDR